MIDHINISIVVERKNDIVIADEADECVEPIDKYPKYYLGKVFGKKELKLALLRKRRGNIEEYVPNYSKAFSTSKSVAQIMADRISKTLYRNHCYSTEILPEFYPVDLFKAWHEQQQYVQAIRFPFSDTIDEIMQKVNEPKDYYNNALMSELQQLCAVARKEKTWWMKGKKTDLLTCELREIENNKEGEDAVRELFQYFVVMSENLSKDAIKEILYILNKYNSDHDNKYKPYIDALYEEPGKKNTTQVNIFHKDSCHFGQGSSMNGDVLLNNKN